MDLRSRARRSSVFIDAHINQGEPFSPLQTVRIRDISEGGARIQAQMRGKSPAVGARILIVRGETEMPCRVVWSADHHFGVAFDDPVDVAAVLKAASPKSQGKPAYAEALTSGLASGLAQVQRGPSRHRRPLPRFGLPVAAAR